MIWYFFINLMPPELDSMVARHNARSLCHASKVRFFKKHGRFDYTGYAGNYL